MRVLPLLLLLLRLPQRTTAAAA
eukprot:COSAG01_NODE_48961_length_376_cov_1.032491_1_plen_22_part_10